jgi:feruloyl esterase
MVSHCGRRGLGLLREIFGVKLSCLAFAALWALSGWAHAADITRTGCRDLAAARLGAGATVVSAAVVAPQASDKGRSLAWAPPQMRQLLQHAPEFCRILVRSEPGRESRIGVEVWLPLSGWNGRYLGTGNGGYPLAVMYPQLMEGISEGYATANTDLGLAGQVLSVSQARLDPTQIFVGRPFALVDFGSRATHEMTWIAKSLIHLAYGISPRRSYFDGCSTGGMQAFSEIERYPADYDGVVAGAPGENRARVHLSILWDFMSVWQRPAGILSDAHLALVHSAVLKACAVDGKPYLRNPSACRWRPETLLCGRSDAGKNPCLTKQQVQTVNLLYQGPRNPRTGEQYMVGLPRGSELGWTMYMRQAGQELPFRGVFAFALGPRFSFQTFDWDRDAETFIAATAPYFDATDLDMRAFVSRNGKLLWYHGGADPLAPLGDDIRFYDAMKQEMTGAGLTATAFQSAFRFYVLPGMSHCAGGEGPDQFDRLQIISNWVEHGSPPDSLVVSKNGAQSERLTPLTAQ